MGEIVIVLRGFSGEPSARAAESRPGLLDQQVRALLIAGQILTPWKSDYQLLDIEFDPTGLCGDAFAVPGRARATLSRVGFLGAQAFVDLRQELKWHFAIYAVIFEDRMLGTFSPNVLDLAAFGCKPSWVEISHRRAPPRNASRLLQIAAADAEGSVSDSDPSEEEDDAEPSQVHSSQNSDADSASRAGEGSDDLSEALDDAEDFHCRPSTASSSSSSSSSDSSDLSDEAANASEAEDASPLAHEPREHLGRVPPIVSVDIGTRGRIKFMANGNFLAECFCHPNCQKAAVGAAARRAGKGRPLGFLMCWLRTQRLYDDAASHNQHHHVLPLSRERRKARGKLLGVPGARLLFRHEKGSDSRAYDDESDTFA